MSIQSKKTIFNYVALYNNLEKKFAEFLDRCPDIHRFAALADLFKVDYISSRGSIRYYFPDFVACQNRKGKLIHWILETKGREYGDILNKDKANSNWCNEISTQTKQEWKYLKVPQRDFEKYLKRETDFYSFIKFLKGNV
ncbi:MAG: restriction endonuclease [Promethearchaeota archaeon]